MVRMNLDFVPLEITKRVKQHNGSISSMSPPKHSNSFDYLSFAKVQITTPKTSLEIELLRNTNISTAFQVNAIKWNNHEFMDEPLRLLLVILDGLLAGNTGEKKTIFGKRKVFVIGLDGNKYV